MAFDFAYGTKPDEILQRLYDLSPKNGLWTPSLTGSGGQSGQTYATQVGRYVKKDGEVFVHGRITLTALGTLTTSVRLSGLPFACDNVTGGQAVLQCWFLNLTNAKVGIWGLVSPNTTFADLYTAGGAVTSLVALVQADLANTTDLVFSGTYRTAS